MIQATFFLDDLCREQFVNLPAGSELPTTQEAKACRIGSET